MVFQQIGIDWFSEATEFIGEVQILTIEELLAGGRPDYPATLRRQHSNALPVVAVRAHKGGLRRDDHIPSHPVCFRIPPMTAATNPPKNIYPAYTSDK